MFAYAAASLPSIWSSGADSIDLVAVTFILFSECDSPFDFGKEER